MHVDFLGEYPDVASFLLIMSIACNNKNKTIIFLKKIPENK